MRDKILVLGAEAQSGRNAARQLRAAHFYGRVLPQGAAELAAEEAAGVIVTEAPESPDFYDALAALNVPALLLGPAAEAFLRRYAPENAETVTGVATVKFEKCELFSSVPDGERSVRGAAQYELPEGMRVVAEAEGRPAAVADEAR